MQAQRFGWIGRGHELGVGLPLLIVQAGNGALKIRHLLANLALRPFGGAVYRLGRYAPARRRLAPARRLTQPLGLLALAIVDFFVHRIEISVVVATIIGHMSIADFDDA